MSQIENVSINKILCYIFLDDDQSKENLERLVKNYEYFDFYYKDNIYFIDNSVCTNVTQFIEYINKIQMAKNLNTEKAVIINAYTLASIFNDGKIDFDTISFVVQFIAVFDTLNFKFIKYNYVIDNIRKNLKNNLFCIDNKNFFVYLISDGGINQKLYGLRILLMQNNPVYIPDSLSTSSYAENPSIIQDFPLNSLYKKN